MKMSGRVTVNRNLPLEIIGEILSWLPVQPLCRFRCLSKSWNSIISDPRFVRIHFNKANENENVLRQRRRVLFTIETSKCLYSLDMDEFLRRNHAFLDFNDNVVEDCENDEPEVVATRLDYICNEFPDNREHYSFNCIRFSHCNGLLLCKLHKRMLYLVNPTTREFKLLPKPPHKKRYFGLGFGFDDSTLDFKVVNGRITKRESKFRVYTLKTGSWRLIQRQLPYKRYLHFDGVLLHGGLHWLVIRADSEPSVALISFNLAEEDVREIPLPMDINFKGGRRADSEYQLGVFTECQCITVFSTKLEHTEFWLMKEYGVKESWTKIKMSIPYYKLSHSGFWYKNHDLLVFQNSLVMYNFNDGSSRDLSIHGDPRIQDAGIYLESLFSPNHYQHID